MMSVYDMIIREGESNGIITRVCLQLFFLNKFIHNMLHYRVILHVLVYTLLHNDLSIAVW